MDIRIPKKLYRKYSSLYNRNTGKYPVVKDSTGKTLCAVSLTPDHDISEPVIMVASEGSLVKWTSGQKNVKSFLKKGYVEIKGWCPFVVLGKCRGIKCRFYRIKNLTGDCGFYWSVIIGN